MRSFPRHITKPLFVLIVVSLLFSACSLPDLSPTQQPAATPTLVPQLLPPTVVETEPPIGSQLGLQVALTIYFNQPMDRGSVESAWSTDPAMTGTFVWADDATLTFMPSQPVEAGAGLTFSLSTEAHASNGIAFQEPVTLRYAAVETLRAIQFLPEPGTRDIRTDAAIVVAFNQPVVPLGAAPESLAPAFSLQPSVQGRGEWLNTSTYIFYPEPGMVGGETYMAVLNETLVSVAGAPLEHGPGIMAAWSFTTDTPRVLGLEPSSEQPLPLDSSLTLTFNQPMDAESVAQHFSFKKLNEEISGSLSWNDDFTALTFEPAALLERNTDYALLLSGQAQARGGTLLGSAAHIVLRTFADFGVATTSPLEGETKTEYGGVELSFTSPVASVIDLERFVSLSPEVPGFGASTYDQTLYVYGFFEPETEYTLTVAPELQDKWGQPLGAPFRLNFSSPTASPRLLLPYLGSDTYFTASETPEFYVQATNISAIDMTVGSVPLNDFFEIFGRGNYQAREEYAPSDALISRQPLDIPRNKSQAVALPLGFGGGALSPGIYYLRIFADTQDRVVSPVYIVASNVNLVFKISATDALVWATDLASGQPLIDTAVTVYNENGDALATGQTNAQGYWHGAIPVQDDSYQNYYAVIGQPGDETFSLASSTWGSDITPWRFGLVSDQRPPHTEVYLYTDRPIYRPGQTVYFRAVVRDVYDGRYTDSGLTSLPINISGGQGDIQTLDLPISEFGTVHGSIVLSDDAQPGYYNFYSNDPTINLATSFQVADYRKPEINLTAAITPEEIKAGESLNAEISARYFFDAPAGGLPVQWVLYDQGDYFSLPEYRVGDLSLGWMLGGFDYFDNSYYGKTLAEGEGSTNPEGLLTLNFSDLEIDAGTRELTLEVTAQDESGQQISARTTVVVHPDDFYIGLRPDLWVGRAETETGFDIFSADWRGDPAPDRNLHADFQQVTWERQEDRKSVV